MKRSTAPWTAAVAAAAIFALPVGGWAQQTSPSTPSSSTSRPAGAEAGQQGTAHEHLRQAKTALNDIPAASLTGTAKTRVAELKRHLTSLEQSAGAGDSASAAGAAGASKSSTGASAQQSKSGWSSEVAAADRILTELLGAQPTSGATEPAGAAGTSGAAGASKQTAGRIALDETTRAKLQEVRAHLTAFAASMSGTPSGGDSTSEPQASASPSAPGPSAAAGQPAAAAPAQAEAAQASSTPAEPTAPEPTSPRPTAQGASGPAAEAATGTSGTAAAAESSPSQAGASNQPETAGQPADADTVKRHLTAARDSLSQLTQLPAAAQLTGDARTQVSQLISNFNELITTNIDWRSAYGKVDANLNSLIGDQRTDESATPTANPQGALGASGTASIDPTIRAKLVEMRTHLVEFEKAAGGSGASASSMAPSASSAPSSGTNTAAPNTSPETASSTTASAGSSTSSTPGATSSAGATSENPAPAGTSGAAASTPSPAATSGSAGVDAQGQSPGAKSADSADRKQGVSDDKQAGHAEAMRHIEAIEAILNGGSAEKTAGTSGSTSGANRPGSGSTVSSLDRTQIEQIRTHLNELRRSMSQR